MSEATPSVCVCVFWINKATPRIVGLTKPKMCNNNLKSLQQFICFCIATADSSCIAQDGYVPYHSARIEPCNASSADYSRKGKVFLEMLNDCLDQIRAPSSDHRMFMRCDINFDISLQGRNLNTIIGRAAHIEFLESDIFAKFIMWSFPDLFRWLTIIICVWTQCAETAVTALWAIWPSNFLRGGPSIAGSWRKRGWSASLDRQSNMSRCDRCILLFSVI